jgi:hypothetical protein
MKSHFVEINRSTQQHGIGPGQIGGTVREHGVFNFDQPIFAMMFPADWAHS